MKSPQKASDGTTTHLFGFLFQTHGYQKTVVVKGGVHVSVNFKHLLRNDTVSAVWRCQTVLLRKNRCILCIRLIPWKWGDLLFDPKFFPCEIAATIIVSLHHMLLDK